MQKILIHKCWAAFQILKKCPSTVKDSIPILWFGDLEAYRNSKCKIVTLGINPSNVEFCDNYMKPCGVSCRFPKASPIVTKTTLSTSDIIIYEQAMNDYFKNTDPRTHKLTYYKHWFDYYENALNALSASYFSNLDFPNTAIHIDLCTPVATDKWSSLSKAQKINYIKKSGVCLCDLLSELKPDVIISCLNQNYIKTNFKNKNGMPCVKSNADYNFEKVKSGKVISYIRAYQLNHGCHLNPDCVLIWGHNRNTPFAGLTKTEVQTQIKKVGAVFSIP